MNRVLINSFNNQLIRQLTLCFIIYKKIKIWQLPRITTILQIKSYLCHFVELEKIRYTCFFFSCANEF